MRKLLVSVLLLTVYAANAQVKTDALLKDILFRNKDSLLQSVLKNPEEYRYQIIYTQINRDQHNKPSFKNYYFNVDKNRYFNPASVVKMPLAFLSLEKLNKLHQPGVDLYTTILTDSGWSNQTIAHTDSTAESGKPSVAQYIRKAFLISDNDAYNRLYEFIGQQTINHRLHELGYPDTRITRRFRRMTMEENRHTNPIRFVDAKGNLLYEQPMAYNPDSFDFSHINKMGHAYLDANDSLINEPIDFTKANNFPLEDMRTILQSVIFPQSVPAKQRFNLTKKEYDFLYRFLSQYPSETNYPKYDTSVYYDSYVKFYFRGNKQPMPSYVRVFNKVGWAYGCLTDISYVVDFKNKTEFILAATLYTNKDGVLNDDKYEYETVGWPFLYQVGQTIYQYELKRKKKYLPDLSGFKIAFRKRAEDGRPAVKNADN
ncbi:MAG: serine hydrolase [Sphingobacteriales bacterium]|nr:serine hydrolase [Sphingobacteriales bacterium]MBI3720063.1 serine hydrolase [Sphingobacteriales bacterium]